MRIIKFSVYNDGGWICASGENDTIFTQAKSYDTLLTNINEAVRCHFDIKDNEFEIIIEKEKN